MFLLLLLRIITLVKFVNYKINNYKGEKNTV